MLESADRLVFICNPLAKVSKRLPEIQQSNEYPLISAIFLFLDCSLIYLLFHCKTAFRLEGKGRIFSRLDVLTLAITPTSLDNSCLLFLSDTCIQ